MKVRMLLRGAVRFVSTCCLLGLWHAVPLAQAASFDCAKAGTNVEHSICDSSYLSQLDEVLNSTYQELLQDDVTQADTHRLSQRQWLKQRNACENSYYGPVNTTSNCVMTAYQTRQLELSKLLQTAPGYKPPPRFSVSHGKGWTVCESYTRYLNSLPESTPLPLCHIPRYPDFPDLKEPDWEVLDLRSKLELVYTLEKILSPSMHDRPVDTFDHWKTVFEQQINDGTASPRLRRTHLALLDKEPVETILAYEPDQDSCDREMQRQGYAYRGAHTKLFVWDEQEQRIAGYGKQLAFGIPWEMMLHQGKPLLFSPYWGGGTYPRLTGGINIYHFVSAGVGNQYGSVPRCAISFELPSTLIERMTK